MPANSRDIVAVIPNWNGAARLRRHLPSLAHLQQVIVVDNGSTDDSAAAARENDARWIGLDRNYGFAKAVNTGILAAPTGAYWIAILNNDIALEPGFFEALAQTDTDFAAPRLLSRDGQTIDGAFDLIARSGAAYRAGSGRPAADPYFQQPRDIVSAPMTAALFRRTLFDDIGLLDETFGSYLEDVDFGIRCALAGRKGRYVPTAVALHEGSASSGGPWSAMSTRLISRNQVLLARKYAHEVWPAVWGQLLWGVLAVRHGAGLAWLRGKLEGLKAPVQRDCHQKWRELVLESERTIRELQSDWYWTQYFRGIGKD